MSRKILIVAPAWLGDMIMAHSLVQVLKERFVDARIDVLAPKSTLLITELMAEFTQRILMPDTHGEFSLKNRWRLARQLKKENYDLVYILPNTWKAALVPFMARIPCRVGWLGEARYGLLTRYLKEPECFPKMVQRYVALGFLAGDYKNNMQYPVPKIKIPEDLRKRTLKKFNIALVQPCVLLSPGAAFGPAKRWPVEYFKEVAQYFIKRNYAVWIVGGAAEDNVAQYIQSHVPEVNNFVGKTDILEMAVLIDLADKILTNDSGPMHVAAALDKPLVAIFGASSAEFTPPLSAHAQVLERLDLECRPCFQRECPLIHLNCLRGIKPEAVIAALEKL